MTERLPWSISAVCGHSAELIWELPETPFRQLRKRFEFWDGHGEVSYSLTGTVKGEPFEQQGSFCRRRKWTVFVTSHAHVDNGITHRATEVAERHAFTVDWVLERLASVPALSYHMDDSLGLEIPA
jgi:hypothetical protein